MADAALDYLLRDERYQRLKPMSRYLAIILWASRHMNPWGFAKVPRSLIVAASGIEKDLDACMHNLTQERLIAWHQPSSVLWARDRLKAELPLGARGTESYAAKMHAEMKLIHHAPPWLQRALQQTVDIDLGFGYAMSRHQWRWDLKFPPPPNVPDDLPIDHSPEIVILSEVARKRAERAAKIIGDDGETVEQAVAMWNAMAARAGLSPVMMLSDTRRATMAVRLREIRGIENWAQVIGKIEASDFLCCRTAKPFRADFDWATNLANLTRVREGKYDNYAGRAPSGAGPTNGDEIRRGLADAVDRRRRMAARAASPGGSG